MAVHDLTATRMVSALKELKEMDYVKSSMAPVLAVFTSLALVPALGLPAQAATLHPDESVRESQALRVTFVPEKVLLQGEQVKVSKGFMKVDGASVTAYGSGTRVKGKMKGKITGKSYKALWKVYGLEDNRSTEAWIFRYKQNRKHDEIKLANEETNTVEIDVEQEYWIEGNDYGINTVSVGYSTIQIETVDQVTGLPVKSNYPATNKESAKAKGPDGKEYEGDFEPI